jgi:hypothetical protein
MGRGAVFLVILALPACARLDPLPTGSTRSEREQDVAEIVLRDMIEKQRGRPGWTTHVGAVCLAIRNQDPSPIFLERFAALLPPAKPASACAWSGTFGHVVDSETGKPAIVLEVSGIKWHTGSHATVTCSYLQARLSAGGYTYDVVRSGSGWRVRWTRMEYIA